MKARKILPTREADSAGHKAEVYKPKIRNCSRASTVLMLHNDTRHTLRITEQDTWSLLTEVCRSGDCPTYGAAFFCRGAAATKEELLQFTEAINALFAKAGSGCL